MMAWLCLTLARVPHGLGAARGIVYVHFPVGGGQLDLAVARLGARVHPISPARGVH